VSCNLRCRPPLLDVGRRKPTAYRGRTLRADTTVVSRIDGTRSTDASPRPLPSFDSHAVRWRPYYGYKRSIILGWRQALRVFVRCGHHHGVGYGHSALKEREKDAINTLINLRHSE